MLRAYARVVGLGLVALGLMGFVSALGWALATNFYHVAVGSFFIYAGFLQRDAEDIRSIVGGLGTLLLLVKGATIVLSLLFSASPLYGPIEISCLVVGLLSILAARYLRDGTPAGGDRDS